MQTLLEENRAAQRRRYEEDLDENRVAKRRRYEEDLEENRAAKRRRYEENLEENRAAKRRQYEDNSAAIKASKRSRYWNDPAVRLAKCAAERTRYRRGIGPARLCTARICTKPFTSHVKHAWGLNFVAV